MTQTDFKRADLEKMPIHFKGPSGEEESRSDLEKGDEKEKTILKTSSSPQVR